MPTKIIPVQPYQKKYLDKNVDYTQWESLSHFAQELINQNLHSTEDLIAFLYKKNELDVIVSEQLSSYELESARFVNARANKPNEKEIEEDLRSNYNKTDGVLTKKIVNSPFVADLIKEHPEFRQMMLNIQNQDKIYVEENESVTARLVELKRDYRKVNAQHKILVNGEEMNLYQASQALKDASRAERKATALDIEKCREKHSPKLDEIFDEMVKQRHLLATQAGYENYRDYIWDEKSRVDYSPEDCNKVCSAIANHFIPVYKEVIEKRKQCLGLKDVFSYDMQLDLGTAPPLVFPKGQEALFSKMRKVFQSIHPDFSEALDYLIKNDRLDFETRPDKMTAMFSMYFPETRLPFVFYVTVDSLYDIHGPIHEVTHGIHSMYYNSNSLLGLQRPGSEVSELFTFSMELISMEYWDVYFEDQQNLIRAKLKKLENCLAILRMVGRWDDFQHWAYTHPRHTRTERNLFWNELSKKYDIGIQPTQSIPAEKNTEWQHRPLIYFVPFYLIEYVFAQFGAFEIYRQYRENPKQTMDNLIAAMKLGNTRSIQETYNAAGVQFDFSEAYVKKITEFVGNEYNRLFAQLEF